MFVSLSLGRRLVAECTNPRKRVTARSRYLSRLPVQDRSMVFGEIIRWQDVPSRDAGQVVVRLNTFVVPVILGQPSEQFEWRNVDRVAVFLPFSSASGNEKKDMYSAASIARISDAAVEGSTKALWSESDPQPISER